MQGKGRNRFRRFIIRFILGFFLVILILVVYFVIIAIDHPPRVEDLTSLQTQRLHPSQNTYLYGHNWLRKSESGLWEAYIEGKPFERGVAFGRLTKELLYYQESSFVEQIRELVPSDAYLKVLKYFIAFFNRNLDTSIPEEYRYEIYGTSFSCSPEFDFIGSGYQRQLNYHAAHDIGHALQGLNMVGCTSFSVWNSSSADSSLLVARNFDFYMGKKFGENKIVCFVNPSSGHKFMMITWADLIGVVSGMNDQGLTVTLNAAKSAIPHQAATPVTLLAREILQYASNIEEAYNISKKRKLFVSESIMIGSARDGKTAIIEKSPDHYDLVYPDSSRIICSNHYQGKVFAHDEINLENIRGSDSYSRYMRVKELLSVHKMLNVGDMVQILRDQRGLGNINVGMGNQLSINQLIAHHSVVFKPDSLLVWVSAGPWQEGRFICYDLKKVFNLDISQIKDNREIYLASRTIPADTFMNSENFRLFREYQTMSDQLAGFRKTKQPLPQNFDMTYRKTNPSLYLTYVHLAEYYEAIGIFDKALSCYNRALSCSLPGLDEEQKLKEKADELNKKIDHGISRN
jgi:isopenicillin-N N-acyltransferase-like protein